MLLTRLANFFSEGILEVKKPMQSSYFQIDDWTIIANFRYFLKNFKVLLYDHSHPSALLMLRDMVWTLLNHCIIFFNIALVLYFTAIKRHLCYSVLVPKYIYPDSIYKRSRKTLLFKNSDFLD